MIDFHVYVHGGSVQVVMDEKDPQREENMKDMAENFNAAGRYREADECLKHGTVSMTPPPPTQS